jgi:hypothetical protein
MTKTFIEKEQSINNNDINCYIVASCQVCSRIQLIEEQIDKFCKNIEQKCEGKDNRRDNI